MARAELREATIYFKDGLAGTGQVNDVAGLLDGATTVTLDNVVLNTENTDEVPVGARFKVAGEANDADGCPVTHTVTAVTPTTGTTTSLTFSPAIATGSSIADDAAITFEAQRIEVKIGDGNVTWTEAKEIEYQLDRGVLDTVRQGDDQPVQVQLAFVYEFVRTGTDEVISPVDAIKGIGGASSWISSSPDKCEPYSVDLCVERNVECSGAAVAERETIEFPQLRCDQLQFDLDAASISVTARSFATEATVTRHDCPN